jgi:hypothetical protein
MAGYSHGTAIPTNNDARLHPSVMDLTLLMLILGIQKLFSSTHMSGYAKKNSKTCHKRV